MRSTRVTALSAPRAKLIAANNSSAVAQPLADREQIFPPPGGRSTVSLRKHKRLNALRWLSSVRKIGVAITITIRDSGTVRWEWKHLLLVNLLSGELAIVPSFGFDVSQSVAPAAFLLPGLIQSHPLSRPSRVLGTNPYSHIAKGI